MLSKIKHGLAHVTQPPYRQYKVIIRHFLRLFRFKKINKFSKVEDLCFEFDEKCSVMLKLGLRTEEEYNLFKERWVFFKLKSHLGL
jgi:hypothetical protein